MAKNEIGEYDETDSGNTDISGLVLSDATQIDQLDNIARAQMGALKRWFKSSLFRLRDSTDQTKMMALDLSGLATGTTRTLTVPNASGTIALTGDVLFGWGANNQNVPLPGDNFETLRQNGVWRVAGETTGTRPADLTGGIGQLLHMGQGSNYATQIMTAPNSTDATAWVRNLVSGTWTDWVRLGGNSSLTAKTANYTVTLADRGKVVSVDATSGAITIALPSAVTVQNGFVVSIRKSDSGANFVTIDGNGSQTINGQLTYALTLQNQLVKVMSDGSNWVVVEELGTVINGFNANGYFAKYANGKLECWVSGLTVTATGTNVVAGAFVSPVTFSSVPQVITANLQFGGSTGTISLGDISAVFVDLTAFPTMTVRMYRANASAANWTGSTALMTVRAIGRWFE